MRGSRKFCQMGSNFDNVSPPPFLVDEGERIQIFSQSYVLFCILFNDIRMSLFTKKSHVENAHGGLSSRAIEV